MKRNAVSLSFFLSLMLLTGCTDSINNESKSNNKKVEESDSIEETSFDIKKEYLVRAHVLDKVYEFTYPKPLNPHVIVDLLMPINDDVDEEIKDAQNIMNKYKLKLTKQETFNLTIEGSLRNILVIRK